MTMNIITPKSLIDPHTVEFVADDFIRAVDVIEANGWNNGGSMRSGDKCCYVAAVATAVYERFGGGSTAPVVDEYGDTYDPIGFGYELPVDEIRQSAGIDVGSTGLVSGPAGKTIRWNDSQATNEQEIVADLKIVAEFLATD